MVLSGSECAVGRGRQREALARLPLVCPAPEVPSGRCIQEITAPLKLSLNLLRGVSGAPPAQSSEPLRGERSFCVPYTVTVLEPSRLSPKTHICVKSEENQEECFPFQGAKR